MKPTERFSNRVSDYAKFRPNYPREIFPFLQDAIGLKPNQIVADIGSGTGIFTKQLLDFGLNVYAVEPNQPMREVAEQELTSNPRFTSFPGTAEATGLPSHSANHIFAAQAFHWFLPEPTQAEWKRIIKPGGFAVLLWNNPKMDGSHFQIGYEEIKEQYGTDFKELTSTFTSRNDTKNILFGGRPPLKQVFSNFQLFDYSGLQGRLLSSSYAPTSDHPNYQPMLKALRALFDQCQRDGKIRMEYTTEVFYGPIR